jgi:hypothetical protein
MGQIRGSSMHCQQWPHDFIAFALGPDTLNLYHVSVHNGYLLRLALGTRYNCMHHDQGIKFSLNDIVCGKKVCKIYIETIFNDILREIY